MSKAGQVDRMFVMCEPCREWWRGKGWTVEVVGEAGLTVVP